VNCAKLANWVGSRLVQAHRGSFVEAGRLVIFGNDGLADPAAVHEMELVLSWVRKQEGYRLTGIGSSADAITWVVVVDSGGAEVDTGPIDRMLWRAWHKTRSPDGDRASDAAYEKLQYELTVEALKARPPLPKDVLAKEA
jgi:hypothetical protein